MKPVTKELENKEKGVHNLYKNQGEIVFIVMQKVEFLVVEIYCSVWSLLWQTLFFLPAKP